MENAAEALKIAAWLLIFIVALSICINSFTQSRETIDAILEYNDRDYIDPIAHVEEGTRERTVGYETIMPTIYRAYKENYKIVFLFNDTNYVLYKKKNNPSEIINYIDLEKETLGSNPKIKEEFIEGILFGNSAVDDSNMLNDTFHNIQFNSTGYALYDMIKGKEFTEYLGMYYQEETTGDTSTPEANKTKKRVITYEEN